MSDERKAELLAGCFLAFIMLGEVLWLPVLVLVLWRMFV